MHTLANQVLRATAMRGLPKATREQVLKSLASMPGDQRIAFAERIRRLTGGLEDHTDMSVVSEWLRGAASADPDCEGQGLGDGGSSETQPSAAVLTLATAARKETLHADREFAKAIHVYGSSGALALEPTVIDSPHGPAAQVHTVVIEGVAALERGQYPWDRKIIFRLTARELPIFAAVLMGKAQRLNCAHHGSNRDKSLSVVDQGASVFVRMEQPGHRPVAVPIPASEMLPVCALVLGQVCKNMPLVPGQLVIELLGRIGDMHNRELVGAQRHGKA